MINDETTRPKDKRSEQHRLSARQSGGLVPWRAFRFRQLAESGAHDMEDCSGRRFASGIREVASGPAPSTAQQHWAVAAFSLVELLVTVAVLALLVLLFTQLLNSAATITTLAHKQMDADSQARQLLDRMAVDFAQLVKRSDVDFFGKGTVAPNSVGGAMTGNDQIAFYSGVPGYYPSTGSQSPVSLVSYRINSNSTSSSYHKL